MTAPTAIRSSCIVCQASRRRFLFAQVAHRQRCYSQVAPPSQPDVSSNANHDILFCGSDQFAHIILARLIQAKELYRSLHVLTSPGVNDFQSWGGSRMKTSTVKALAQEHSVAHHIIPKAGIEHFTLPFSSASSRGHQENSSPLLVTASFGHFLPPSFLNTFTSQTGVNGGSSRALNVHPSLLPHLRGAAPIQWAIARSEDAAADVHAAERTASSVGVTIQELSVVGFDRGRILLQLPFALQPHSPPGEPPTSIAWTYATLMPLLAHLGADALLRVLRDLDRCASYATPQDDALATYAPKLRSDKHGVVQWTKWSARRIEARWRGFGHHFPFSTMLHPAPEAVQRGAFKPTSMSFHDLDLITARELNKHEPYLAAVLRDESSQPGHAVFCAELPASARPTVLPADSEAKDKIAHASSRASSDSPSAALLIRCAPSSVSSSSFPSPPTSISSSAISARVDEAEAFLVVRETRLPGKKRRRIDREWWNGFRDRADARGRLRFASS
ncbi:Formyltransferase [Tilletiaria anomala UBC 951]|uniref:methionyl-tRNA formyltransferase n=1 Tax=Tilletiaria anomala (strain ATCC 24038 / CBS 436.72 / UBC 951) TaxID=1037660 RepID=A0A066WEJ4_TILAU|nr:Formyltransferase [Tilletiaria anomala UBC 951]KDN52191.1 Formyltransferase [Tilletiaria anomala UBC 951]